MADTNITIKITNVREIRSAFNKAPDLMIVKLSQAIQKSVFLIKGRSMQNTPVKTGRLRASTYTNFAPLKGEVGTNTNYDRFVHWGTRFMKARPYLKNAVDDSNSEVNRFLKEAVDSVLNDIGRAT